MADNAGMSIQPDEVLEISRQVDALADRIHRMMRDEAANLAVVPPARDEVSQRIANTLSAVHSSFDIAAGQGVDEMHEVAATLRAHSNNVIAADSDFVS